LQIRRSLWITFAFTNASMISLFLVSLVLARILTPKEIGVFSLCMVIINVASVFRDLGTVPYLIRKKDVSPADIGSCLGITLTNSWILALGIWLGRDWIASYFGEPQMAEVLPILLLGFVMIPVASIMTSLLIRDLSAERSAVVAIGTTLAYASVVLTLASMGFGALAPAWANTANLVASLLGYWAVMPKGFRMWPRWSGWGPPLRYSGGIVLTNLAGTAHNSVPDTVIGRSLGAHDVGLFSRANGTVSLFNQIVGPTLNLNALPIIAKTHHEDSGALAGMLKRSTEMLTGLAWPIYIWVAIFPTEIISFLYGKTWVEAAALVPWLCLAAAARAPFLIIGPALQAIDRPFTASLAAMFGLAMRVLVVASFSIQDLHQFAMMLCLADLLGNLAWVLVAHKYLGISPLAALVSQRRSIAIGAACAAAALLVRYMLDGHAVPLLVSLALSGVAILVAWLATLHLVHHPFAVELRKVRSKITG
jgi:O-antigen/teichoic acid export membrane protein